MGQSKILLDWLKKDEPLLHHEYSFPRILRLRNNFFKKQSPSVYEIIYPNQSITIGISPTCMKKYFQLPETRLNIHDVIDEDESQNLLWEAPLVVYASKTLNCDGIGIRKSYRTSIVIVAIIQLMLMLQNFFGLTMYSLSSDVLSNDYMLNKMRIRNIYFIFIFLINLSSIIYISRNIKFLRYNVLFLFLLSFYFFITSISNIVDVFIILISGFICFLKLRLAHHSESHAFRVSAK